MAAALCLWSPLSHTDVTTPGLESPKCALPGYLVPIGLPASSPQLPCPSAHIYASSQPAKTQSSAGKMPLQSTVLALSEQTPSAWLIIETVVHHCKLILPWSSPCMAPCGNYIFYKVPERLLDILNTTSDGNHAHYFICAKMFPFHWI